MLRNSRIWLGVLLAWMCLYQRAIAYAVIDDLRHGQQKPDVPFNFGFRMQQVSGMTNEAFDAGVRFGDVVETVDGKPFSSMRILYEAVNSRKPGDFLPASVRSARGTPFNVSIRIPAVSSRPSTLLEWMAQLAVAVGLPAFCLSLGFWVAFQRPDDRLAWFLLAMMIGFGGLAQEFPINTLPGQLPMLSWWAVFGSSSGLWTTWMLLFAISFPNRPKLDLRLPWLKWMLIAPLLLLTVGMSIFEIGREISFGAISFLRPYIPFVLATRPDVLFPVMAVVLFFVIIGLKGVTSNTVDGKRRLRILLLGSLISCGPILVQSLRSIEKQSDLLLWAGPLEYFATLMPLLLFPLTLTYVIVIRRAMDVKSTLREGIQYALAQRGLTVLQIIVTAAVIASIAILSANKYIGLAARVETIAVGFLTIVLLRRGAQWLAWWVDRRFFREAHSNEQILNELTLSLRTLMEENTLLQTVAQKISAALHVPRIAFLLNAGGQLTPAYSTASPTEQSLTLAESGGVVRHLKVLQKAAPVYFDDRKNWIQTIHPAEQETLKNSQTEVVLPVSVKDKLLGVLALGPRQADAPYTDRDLQLLDAFATQAGFALENSRLSTQFAYEIATREKLSREMEIAREVQERLFPQNFPVVPGIDYFGTCRPALACGGDYYDFLTLPNGSLCIAIGDVSGKGIAAALLMASLQASVRGQAAQNGNPLAGQIGVVNRLIYNAPTVHRYATFFYAQYNPQTRELKYVNAGHNPPMILRKNGDGHLEVIRLEIGGPVVGLLPNAPYLEDRVQLKENDLFVGFTDGIGKAMNSQDEEWGEERMIEVLERCDGSDAASIAKSVILAADVFVNGRPSTTT